MKIKKIKYQNLKGRSEEIELGAANLIFGNNFTGKTTIIDAIKLALLGYHPALDKTARGIFELSSDEVMEAEADFDDGRAVARAWQRDRMGKLTKREFIPRDWPNIPVVLLDANAYFGASDRGKTELLFSASKMNADPVKFASTIRGLKEIIPETTIAINGKTPQDWVNSALETVERLRSEAAASVKRYADTMQGLSALRDAEPVVLDADVQEQVRKKRAERETAQAKLRSAERRKDLHENTHTPEEGEVEELEEKSRRLGLQITNKEIEIGKAEARWDSLLNHRNCPMCGTEGKKWKPSAKAKKKAELEVLTKEKIELTRERFNTNRAVDERKPKLAEAREKLLKKDAAAVLECEEAVAGLNEEIASLESHAEAFVKDQADRRRLDEARAQHERYSIEEKRAKEAKTYLLKVKEQMTRELFAPILKMASKFTTGIFTGELLFHEGELGMIKREKRAEADYVSGWIPHRTFSGTEQAIAFAALQAALGATAPIKLVVMDELGRLDFDNKCKLMRNVLNALNDGTIDQFVGVDTDAEAAIGEGFTLIERR